MDAIKDFSICMGDNVCPFKYSAGLRNRFHIRQYHETQHQQKQILKNDDMFVLIHRYKYFIPIKFSFYRHT